MVEYRTENRSLSVGDDGRGSDEVGAALDHRGREAACGR